MPRGGNSSKRRKLRNSLTYESPDYNNKKVENENKSLNTSKSQNQEVENSIMQDSKVIRKLNFNLVETQNYVNADAEINQKLTNKSLVNAELEANQKLKAHDKQKPEAKSEGERELMRTSKEFIDAKKEEFFKLIDFSTEKQNLNKFQENLKKYFSKENINKLLNQQGSLNNAQEKNSQNRIKHILSNFTESKQLLVDSNQTLVTYLKSFAADINELLKKHNYYDEANKLSGKIKNEFGPSAFHDHIVEKFKSQEKDSSSIDNFNYKNKHEKYKGEKIITVDQDGKKFKQRQGFGYYEHKSSTMTSFYGLFHNDEYSKGYLVIEEDNNNNNSKTFNGEFASEQEIFNGLYLYKDPLAKSVFIMLGKTNLKQASFNGILIKLEEQSLSLYIGEIANQSKNSQKAILIDFIIHNSKLDESCLNYQLSYGDFENNQPAFSDKNNAFYVYKDNSLLKLSGNKVFSVFSHDKETDFISQGELKKDALNGKAALFDSKSNIYYSGDVKDGAFNGKGSLITFDYEEDNCSSVILIKGDFQQNQITNSTVYQLQKKTDKVFVIENAVLSVMGFEIIFGKIKFEDGEFYEGKLLDNRKHGRGKYVYFDGSYYDGEWKNDKKDGEGVYTLADKTKIKGIWDDDRIQK